MTAPKIVMPSQIVMRATASLVGYARNSRTHDERQIDVLAKSITEYGFTNPILIDGDRGVIAGHGRIMAAEKLGLPEVPCIELRHLTNEQKRAYLIADNAIGTMSGWNEALLAQELADLSGVGFEAVNLGFDAAEVDRLMEILGEEFAKKPIELVPDETPSPPVVPVTRLGDVWNLNGSLLRCGDSTDVAAIAILTGGSAVGLVVFDPPFERSDLVAMIWPQIQVAPDVLVFGDCINDTSRRVTVAAPWRFQFVWDGVTRWVVPGRPLIAHKTCDWFSTTGQYDHEAVKDPRNPRTEVERGSNSRGEYELPPDPRGKCMASVFRSPVTQESHGAEHSKPVLWLQMLIGNCSQGDVLDVFAGSGTTLLACTTLNRRWFGSELNPAYCDVIVRRWTELTGDQPTLDGDGRTFAEMTEARHADR